MANVEMLLIPGGLVFTLRIKSAEICVICGYNSSGFGMASRVRYEWIISDGYCVYSAELDAGRFGNCGCAGGTAGEATRASTGTPEVATTWRATTAAAAPR